MIRSLLIALLTALVLCVAVRAQEEGAKKDKGPLNSGTFSGFKLRNVGPAMTSGRIGDIAVDPRRPSRWIVAVASGGVWKTVNAGTTWKPVFDGQGSYSIGCVTLDPSDPNTVWVGTGENNSQRSVSYGDGVYKSVDGGRSWKNVGLKDSEHIGKIIVHPDDSSVVYVAAQGPLWNAGGERGLYKTTDGGKSWSCVLEISENTGVSDLVMDPRDPDVLYASAYQRRRHVWTLINGGPESAIHKSTDGGSTWRKLKGGLPSGDVGRIGLALAPSRPDTLYAIIEAARGKGGFFRSVNAGETWKKMNSYVSGSPQYYQEIVVDPLKPDRVYSNDVRMRVTEDGGKTFSGLNESAKHVDNHAIWIDPRDTDHLLVGCDGGLYETFDRGQAWQFKANLPVTQFYRVTADNDFPFYNVYGGTQDNASLGAPSRTTNAHGITNADWYMTRGGDGFKTVVDPEDPDTVYSQSQYGGLVRYDRRTGETVDIRPMVDDDHEPLVWNWNAPILISPHSHTRLYFGGNFLFRSDDRGDSWTQLGGNMARAIDRNALKVMGRVWEVDAVSKNRSTSIFGSVVTIAESPLKEGWIWLGTDDGLIHASRDGGRTFKRMESVPGVPEMTYVTALTASRHAEGTVYAAFDNHKQGDFKPYLLRSADAGETWAPIVGDLPERGTVHAIVEDHVNPKLLFAGTEFGVFFTLDEGGKWIQLKGGLPIIAVRDLAIQERESDLVLGTFGRGIYILDDYSPLRHVDARALEADARIFPIKKAWMFVPRRPIGGGSRGSLGDSFFSLPNPPVAAVFTYWVKKGLQTRKQKRLKAEGAARKKKETSAYPTWEALQAEDRETDPKLILIIKDASGNVVRRIDASNSKGIHRTTWNLRYPGVSPITGTRGSGRGPFVLPGRYTVALASLVDGRLQVMTEPQEFEVAPLPGGVQQAENRQEILAFQKRAAELMRAVQGAGRVATATRDRLEKIVTAIMATPSADPGLLEEAMALRTRLQDLGVILQGDRTRSSRYTATKISLSARVGRANASARTTAPPTKTQRDAYAVASQVFTRVLADLRQLVETDLKKLEGKIEAAGAPWTPGRLPDWKPER